MVVGREQRLGKSFFFISAAKDEYADIGALEEKVYDLLCLVEGIHLAIVSCERRYADPDFGAFGLYGRG